MNKYNRDNDDIIKFKQGDEQSFNKIYNKYKGNLFIFIDKILHNKEDSMEVLQETFLRVVKNIDSYEPDYSFSTWLYTIASNYSKTILRRKKRNQYTSFSDIFTYVNNDYSIFDNTGKGKDEESILNDVHFVDLQKSKSRSLEKISKKYLLMIQKMEEGFSYEEISTMTNTPIGTVKSRINRGRIKLAKNLLSDGYIEDDFYLIEIKEKISEK